MLTWIVEDGEVQCGSGDERGGGEEEEEAQGGKTVDVAFRYLIDVASWGHTSPSIVWSAPLLSRCVALKRYLMHLDNASNRTLLFPR